MDPFGTAETHARRSRLMPVQQQLPGADPLSFRRCLQSRAGGWQGRGHHPRAQGTTFPRRPAADQTWAPPCAAVSTSPPPHRQADPAAGRCPPGRSPHRACSLAGSGSADPIGPSLEQREGLVGEFGVWRATTHIGWRIGGSQGPFRPPPWPGRPCRLADPQDHRALGAAELRIRCGAPEVIRSGPGRSRGLSGGKEPERAARSRF